MMSTMGGKQTLSAGGRSQAIIRTLIRLLTRPFVEAKAMFDGEAIVVGRLSAERKRTVVAYLPRNLIRRYATPLHGIAHLCVSRAPTR